jgi:hypothetical protein
MLGYQRAGVSIAMGSLAKAGLIEHKRGTVTVFDRPGLEAAACDCYREMQDDLDECLPPDRTACVLAFKHGNGAVRR